MKNYIRIKLSELDPFDPNTQAYGFMNTNEDLIINIKHLVSIQLGLFTDEWIDNKGVKHKPMMGINIMTTNSNYMSLNFSGKDCEKRARKFYEDIVGHLTYDTYVLDID